MKLVKTTCRRCTMDLWVNAKNTGHPLACICRFCITAEERHQILEEQGQALQKQLGVK